MKRLLLLLLLVPSAVLAAAPELVVKAPKQGRVGRLIKLDASGSRGFKTLKWVVIPALAEEAVLPSRDKAGNPTQLGFAWDEPGTFTFVLAGSSDDGEISLLTTEITLTGPGPAPGPQPGPGPGPQPGPSPPTPTPVPPAPTSWEGLAVAWAAEVTDPKKPVTAVRIADDFDLVASGIAAGAAGSPSGIKTIAQMEAKVAALRDAMPEGDYERWRPWFAAFNKELVSRGLAGTGKRGTLPQYQEVFNRVSTGLRGVK